MIDRVKSKMFCKREDSKIMCTKVYMQYVRFFPPSTGDGDKNAMATTKMS
jgi:hypothetical protein